MALIELSNISKSFNDGDNNLRQVLCDINLNIEQGEVISIRGVSGSGKTTLLSILGTILSPDKGVYRLQGEDITHQNDNIASIRNRKIGFLFQDHRLLPQLSAYENILLPILAAADTTTSEEEKYAEELMEMLNVSHLRNQLPATLSGGEACRVALCRALIRKPQLLLADEPTGQLDEDLSQQVANLLLDINRKLGTTIIIVTHSEELTRKAQRQFYLQEGKINEI